MCIWCYCEFNNIENKISQYKAVKNQKRIKSSVSKAAISKSQPYWIRWIIQDEFVCRLQGIPLKKIIFN